MRAGSFPTACAFTMLLGLGCARRAMPTPPFMQSPPATSRPVFTVDPPQPPAIPPGYVRPAQIPFTFRMEWILGVVDSTIRGEHEFEWAEAVAYARAADPRASALKAALPLYADESPELERWLAKFIADVLSPTGPDWIGPDPRFAPTGSAPQVTPRVPDVVARAAKVVERASQDAETEVAALDSLGRSGLYARAYLPLIVARLNSSSASDACRIAAVRALGRLSTVLPEAGESLLNALVDPNPTIHLAAMEAITHWAALDPTSQRIMAPAVASFLRSQDLEVRSRAAHLCGLMAFQNPLVASALIRALTDPSPDIRKLAIEAFLNPDVQKLADTPSIITALRDPDPRIRREAAYLLADRKLDQKEVMDALTAAVDSGNFIVREALADALESADQTHGAALAVLKETASAAPDSTARAYARAALKQLEARRAKDK